MDVFGIAIGFISELIKTLQTDSSKDLLYGLGFFLLLILYFYIKNKIFNSTFKRT